MNEVATQVGRSAGRAWTPLGVGDLIRVARPGLIATHVWTFLFPAIAGGFTLSASFWIAAIYVTVPLGLLIYGWNDYFDRDVDTLSRRKSHRATAAVFGPLLDDPKRTALPATILLAQLPFAIAWSALGRFDLVGWMLLMAAGNALYNGPGLRLSRVPILAELTATSIYLLIGGLGILVHSGTPPLWAWAFAGMVIMNLQILGAIVDRHDDAEVGKRTFSVAFGRTASLAVVLAMLIARVGLSWWFVGDLAATAVIAFGAVLVAGGMSISRWRRSTSAYSTFLLLDWTWLVLVLIRAGD